MARLLAAWLVPGHWGLRQKPCATMCSLGWLFWGRADDPRPLRNCAPEWDEVPTRRSSAPIRVLHEDIAPGAPPEDSPQWFSSRKQRRSERARCRAATPIVRRLHFFAYRRSHVL